jgi:hypothetical protein
MPASSRSAKLAQNAGRYCLYLHQVLRYRLATQMISQYLAPDGFVVSLQNSINEERIAEVVGWGKVIGCIASTIGVISMA